MTRYPGLSDDFQITADMLTGGLNRLSPAIRTSIEVEPNHVTLHIAVGTGSAEENRTIVEAGAIPEHLRPSTNSRGIMVHGGTPVSVLWRTTGRVELEGAHLSDRPYLTGSVRTRRADA